LTWLAHYDQVSQQGESLLEHLRLVSLRASDFASAFSASDEAYLAGVLHDLGKYGENFQRRLKGELKGVDHWSAGAAHALNLYQLDGVAVALAIQGHHIGLQSATKDSLTDLSPDKLKAGHYSGLVPSYATPDLLYADDIDLPKPGTVTSIYQWGVNNASSMLDVRMLFSALVDADFLETEAWFNRDEKGERRYRPAGMQLDPKEALSALLAYVQKLAKESRAAVEIIKMREQLFSACRNAGDKYGQGLFTLTAPTGSGKTLAMLAFALAHAARHNLRRIIVVLPYLTVIEQTVATYREVFRTFLGDHDLKRYVLEDHSLSPGRTDAAHVDDDTNLERLFSENWDAPIVVTTNVQFLESLFSNRPAACRKLHRLARSVVLFDEVQTLPIRLVIPTLGTLSRLTERYAVSVVFATATQPAFTYLDHQVKKQSTLGWQPREIVSDSGALFTVAKRNRIEWYQHGEPIAWDEIADMVARGHEALCVVNTKRQAKLLFEKVKARCPEGVFHLSTNMCPLHRKQTLDRVRTLLQQNRPCYLVSTQCVEAGVDIDFPVVFRSLGPLDAIVQAAGRCNRNALWKNSNVYIFLPQDESYPDSAYEQATDVAASLFKARGYEKLGAAELELFDRYYKELYSVRGINSAHYQNDELLEAIQRQDFVKVGQLYRVIPQDTLNALVPYDKGAFHRLAAEAREQGLSYQWIINARPHSVSLFRPRSPTDPLYFCLEPISIRPGKSERLSNEWYIYRKEEDYDLETGLNPSLAPEAIIA